MRSALTLSVLALFTISFAGCLDGALPATSKNEQEAPAIDLDEKLRIEAKDCIQAGGNSVYPGRMGKIGPFDAADQRPEVGDPVVGAFGMPVTGPSSGIWHIGTMCDTYTYMGKELKNFQMGWIAQMIERPDFDTYGEPRIQFMVADLSFNNQDFVTSTGEATRGAEISLATNMVIEWYAPQKYMHVIITEANHGTFDFTAEIHKEFADMKEDHIRFWMLPALDGSHGHGHGLSESEMTGYRPISLDYYITPKEGSKKLAGESLGTFLHINGEEQHQGNPLGHYWESFDLVIEVGPAPEGITFEETWLH